MSPGSPRVACRYGLAECTKKAAAACVTDTKRILDQSKGGLSPITRPHGACVIASKSPSGSSRRLAANRDMNTERLRPTFCDRLLTQCEAPGRVTISENARAICGSLRSENRSTQPLVDFSDRLSRITSTCFSNAVVIAVVPTSCSESSVTAALSLSSRLIGDSRMSSTIGEHKLPEQADARAECCAEIANDQLQPLLSVARIKSLERATIEASSAVHSTALPRNSRASPSTSLSRRTALAARSRAYED